MLNTKTKKKRNGTSKKIHGGVAPYNLINSYNVIQPTRIPYNIAHGLPKFTTNIHVFENTDSTYSDDFISTTEEYANIISEYFPTDIKTDNTWINTIAFEIVSTSETETKPQKPFFVDWTIPKDSYVIVLGDIHGDISSLKKVFKHWSKIGLITKEGLLNDKIYIISLGDLIDYGKNSLNVLYAMVKLRTNNPGRVMLLSGNHEGEAGCGVSGADKFDQEIAYQELNHKRPALMAYIQSIGPDIMSLRYADDQESFYMMHGMYPAKIKDSAIYLYNDDKKSVSGDDIEIWDDLSQFNHSTYAQWNDLSSDQKSYASSRGVKGGLQLGSLHLSAIMRHFGIKSFIRGHQDSCPTQQGAVDMDYCSKTVAVNVNIGSTVTLSCKDTSRNVYGWCIYSTNTNGIAEEVDLKDVLSRIFTTSMANEKSKTRGGITPHGGYIMMHQDETHLIGGSNKNKASIKGSNINKQNKTSKKGGNTPFPDTTTKYKENCKRL